MRKTNFSRFWFFPLILLLILIGVYFSKGSLPQEKQKTSPTPVQENDLLNAASVENGKIIFQACIACHTFNEGGANQVGPNLFGIVGALTASKPGFEYSEVLLSLKRSEHYWTTDALYEWLRDPFAYAPKTKMVYSGLLDPQDRMDVIAYLMTLK